MAAMLPATSASVLGAPLCTSHDGDDAARSTASLLMAHTLHSDWVSTTVGASSCSASSSTAYNGGNDNDSPAAAGE
jgi:hypothetical protein